MKSKKMSLKTVLIVFFLIELIIAFFFLGSTLHIGTNPDTGQKIWFERKLKL